MNCGQPLEPGTGRQDRKYCSAACKNTYHNAKPKMSSRRYRDKIQRMLDNNYFILRRLLSMGVTSMDVVTMKELHFNFDICTSYRKYGGRNHYCCYEMQYDLTPSRVVNIRNVLERAKND